MKNNPVAKFAHLYNTCKVFQDSKEILYLVSVYDSEGDLVEAEVFSDVIEIRSFQKEMVDSGNIVSITVVE